MGWGIGFDERWQRDIGYGVPAYCDHPGCNAEIDRGLSYVCGGEPYSRNKQINVAFADGKGVPPFQIQDVGQETSLSEIGFFCAQPSYRNGTA